MKRFITLLLIVPLLQIVPVQSQAKMSCKQVTAQTKKLFEGQYQGDLDPLVVFAQTIVKAYTLTLDNKKCFTKKEISDMLRAIKTLKGRCVKAKKDELQWAVEKGACAEYAPLYKYIK